MIKTLKQRAVRSGSWVIFSYLISQVLRLGSNLILTRLLIPEMFGVMAIVSVVMGGLAMFSDVGLLQNIVQSKRGEEADYLDTAWTIQIIRGFFIFFIALLLSIGLYYVRQLEFLSTETVYGNQQLPLLLAVVSITAVISSFNSIHILLLNRKLMLGKLVTIELVSQIIGLIFMLGWAWFQRDIWALVFGGIVASCIKMLLSHLLNLGARCRFLWDKEAVHEIFHFGKWIFLSSILGFFLNQGDRLLLGGVITPKLLGIYTVAFFLANAVIAIFSKLMSSVFYPVLSETVREYPEQLEKVYYRIRNKVDAITFFIAGFIFSSGQVIINILYDQRYQDAGWMLEILGLTIVSSGFFLSGQCFLAQGKAKIVTLMIFIQTCSFFLLFPVLFFLYGIKGALWAIVLAAFLRIIVSSTYLKIYFFYNIKKEFLMLPLAVLGYFLGKQI